jgi:spore maturation protein CgeB
VKILLIHPGASYSTADVEAGLRHGLEAGGAEIIQYRLDGRIAESARWLTAAWRRRRNTDPALVKPTAADVCYRAGLEAIPLALRHQVDVVLIVSATLLHPDVVVLLKRAGLRVVVAFTESPYDLDQELAVARLVDGCWTTERSSVEAFRAVTARAGYLRHGWHDARHTASPGAEDATVAAHDVVFVGTAFRERVAWLSAIDWTGIDLGLYGAWESLGSRSKLRRFVRGGIVPPATTTALYRRAKIGLNLYRAAPTAHAESLNPRAYELARCGVFQVSTPRAEVAEVFGDLVPVVETPAEGTRVLRHWLADEAGRHDVQARVPACVADASWVARAADVLTDLNGLLLDRAA